LSALPPLLAFPAVGTADIASAISVEDNRRFLKAEKAHARELDFPESPADDKSIEVAHLSSGLLRYRVVNPQGKRLVLGFHGFQESLEEFPSVLETTLKNLDIQGILSTGQGLARSRRLGLAWI